MSEIELSSARKKGIYLLPNLFTTLSLFSGFYSIIAAGQHNFEFAAIAIFISMIFDSLDGRVARLINAQSHFGAEYDSLCDMVSFGLAPALLMYEWRLSLLEHLGYGRLAWLSAFFYTACVALRLAKFNLQTDDDAPAKPYFEGLPCPAAAALMASFVWLGETLSLDGHWMVHLMTVLTLTVAGLMVSRIPYRSFKDINLKERIGFGVMLWCVVGLFLISFKPAQCLFVVMMVYVLSGPLNLWRNKQKKMHDAFPPE